MAESVKQSLLTFFVRLLMPLGRICIRHGLKIQDVLDVLKKVLVIAAREELTKRGEKGSVSRVAVMTGLQRRDVMRIDEMPEVVPETGDLLTKVIGHWQQSPKFTTQAGKPRVLTYEGAESEFVQLVRSVSQDLNSYTVLFELERIGAIAKSPRGVRLTRRAYEPGQELEEGLRLLARDSNYFIQGVEENLFDNPATPNLHISTEYDNVCIEDVPKIRYWFLEQGALFHAKARRFISQFDKDLNPKLYKKEGGAKVVFGSFSMTQDPAKNRKD